MLPTLVLIIAIRAECWRPRENLGKAEWTKYQY